jgi:hypothetical protein
VERCGHCGRENTLEHVSDVSIAERPTEIVHRSGAEDSPQATTVATILNIRRCTACGRPTLSTYIYVEDWSDPADFMDFEQIYPPLRSLEDLPSRIKDRYTKMLELPHAPDAFAVRAGRLLEAVCSDQGVPAGNLGPRLNQLVAQDRVPQALADQAHLVRDYRNLGGHDDDVEVEAEDVPLIRGFVEYLLEFLYWGPAKLERGRAELTARLMKAKASAHDS